MKRALAFLSVMVVATLMTGSAFARSGAAMCVNIPFDFYAGSKQLAAGAYVFRMNSPSAGALISVQTQEGKEICTLPAQTNEDKTSRENTLHFDHYGDKHFLSSITIRGTRAGVIVDKIERELRTRAEKDLSPETASIVPALSAHPRMHEN